MLCALTQRKLRLNRSPYTKSVSNLNLINSHRLIAESSLNTRWRSSGALVFACDVVLPAPAAFPFCNNWTRDCQSKNEPVALICHWLCDTRHRSSTGYCYACPKIGKRPSTVTSHLVRPFLLGEAAAAAATSRSGDRIELDTAQVQRSVRHCTDSFRRLCPGFK